MTTFTNTWDSSYKNSPADTDDVSAGAGKIRDTRQDVEERLKVDHSWAGDANDGKHNKVSLRVQTSDPTLDANEASIYAKDVASTAELFAKDEAGNVIQLTSGGILLGGNGGLLTSKSADYTITASDMGGTFVGTADVTFTLPAASSAGAHTQVVIKSNTTKHVQVAPSGTDQIDGDNSTVSIPSYDAWTFKTDGSNWFVVAKSPDYIGKIAYTADNVIPKGWIDADGQAISRTTYSALFAKIGTTYGTGDGSTTFNVPSLRGRGIIGQNDTNLTNGADGSFSTRALGATGGAETHTLTINEMPAHTHTDNTVVSGSGVGSGSGFVGGTTTTGSTGGDQPHNNMQPFIALRALIKT